MAARRWRVAEAAMDRWSAVEQAWQRLRAGLTLFTPGGALNTRSQAEALVAEVLPLLSGPEWAGVRRQLCRPEVFTSLDRTQEGLAAVAAEPGVKERLVQAEGVLCRPEATQGAGPTGEKRRPPTNCSAYLYPSVIGGVCSNYHRKNCEVNCPRRR